MTRKPGPPSKETGITATDIQHAPFVYFEGAPCFGGKSGQLNVTLAAVRQIPNGSEVINDIGVVAYLRCGIHAARELRDALDKSILAAMDPPPGPAN